MKRIIALSMLIVLAITGCRQTENKPEPIRALPVLTTSAIEKPCNPLLHYSGTIKAFKEAHLGATLPGKVEKIYFPLGASVPKNALLAELSGEMLTQAMVEHAALQKDFDRIARLKEKGSVSQMEYDHLKAKLEVSDAKVEMMKTNTQVVAPFAGTIVDIVVDEGENYSLIPNLDARNLSVSSGIIHLMQLNPVKVTIDVNEKDLPAIKNGQPARIIADAYPDKVFEGKISYVKPILSSVSRTAAVEIEISNPGYLLKPGMYANTSITLAGTSGVFVPISAVFRQPGTADDYVYTVENGRAHKLPVQQGITENDLVQVTGIAAGTQVIKTGKASLSEGTLVEIKTK